MLADPQTITVDAVAKTFNRVESDNGGAVYFCDDGSEKYTLTIKHRLFEGGDDGESHLVRLDCRHFHPTTGVYERTSSAWLVLQTRDRAQLTAEDVITANALNDFVTSSLIDDVMARQS